LTVVIAALLLTQTALAANPDEATAGVMAALALILAASALAHDLSTRLGQPVVMGEMLAGVLLRNLPILSPALTHQLIEDVPRAIFAQLGLVLMLFEIGIESTVGEVLQVLGPATMVAGLGALASFGLGWMATSWLLPQATVLTSLFVAGAITSTSAGVPARVIADADCSRLPESRLIFAALGAGLTGEGQSLITPATYSAIVLMVIATCLAGSAALKWRLKLLGEARSNQDRHQPAEGL
jgi:hypothetical protein